MDNQEELMRKLALRQSNLNPQRLDNSFLNNLHCNHEEVNSMLKKLSFINDNSKAQLSKELEGINLSGYLNEAVSSICAPDLRLEDSQAILEELMKSFSAGTVVVSSNSDKEERTRTKAVRLELLIDLYFVGIVEDLSTFETVLKDLTSVGNMEDCYS
ncbi:hypothetical protein ACP4OV_022167 [Aristida adscensionis]